MSMPGFSAECSLGSNAGSYRGEVCFARANAGQVLPMCPVCGSGFTRYYEWQFFLNWKVAYVGRRHYGPCDGIGTQVWGRATDFYITERSVGGGGEDDGQCNEELLEPQPDYRPVPLPPRGFDVPVKVRISSFLP